MRDVTLTEAGVQIFAKALPVVQVLNEEIPPNLAPQEHQLFLALARKATVRGITLETATRPEN